MQTKYNLKYIGRKAKAEDGSLTVFSFTLLVLMVMMGGLAVDLMRYETTRTNLQHTLDRATLASASLTQTLDPEGVVRDYFDKAGMSEYLTSVNVVEGMNFRNVTADATADTKPYFMHMFGTDSMDANGHSMAEQRVNNVEITLVLDVSGSMASNSRLTNLKTAAREFVDTVLASDAEDKISIALVPFNGQVNLGTDLKAEFTNLRNDPGITNVNCVDVPADLYTSMAIAPNSVLSMTAHADTFSSTNTSTTSYVAYTDTSNAIGYHATNNSGNVWCPPIAANILRLPSQNITTLQSQINGLVAVGATSINAGMRWGLAMMDPAMRSTYTSLISKSKIGTELAGRPFDYSDPEAMKVVVLMTDGEHFAQERVSETSKTGLSPIYRATSDGLYSIRHTTGRPSSAGSNEYYVPHLGTWRSTPYSNGGVTQQDWKQIWPVMRTKYVAWQFYARALGTSSSTRNTAYNNALNNLRVQVPTTTMDSQLQAICTLAKSSGVIVYGIAFEAPTNGQTQIRNCASSTAHYFNAQGLQIRSAFRAIASNISQLRLTQ